MKKELTCICCPIGCQITVKIDRDITSVHGNVCPRGDEYAKKEVISPTRIVTSSIRVNGGKLPLVSVKTATDIPKEKIFDVMEEIHTCRINAPIHTGDIIIKNVAGTGADIIATRTVEAQG